MKAGDKVTYIKDTARQEDWTGVVLHILKDTNEVVVAWTGSRKDKAGNVKQVRQVNPAAKVAPLVEETK